MFSRSLFSLKPGFRSAVAFRNFATSQPAILDRNMGEHQWYVHLSRTEGADLNQIKSTIQSLRTACQSNDLKLVVGMGPTLLQDVTNDMPEDFQKFETFKSIDGSGREAKGTQEELLFWITGNNKGNVWKAQFDARNLLKDHMKVARETMTFIYGNSLDMTGFIDGTGNPAVTDDQKVAIVPEGAPGAGGSFILAQRWVHDLEAWNKQTVEEQEMVFGRKKADSARLPTQCPYSHLSHVELTEGETGDNSKPKRDEMSRRSTPYAFHDGTVGLYFMAFCATQAPLRERLSAMYGQQGQVRDRLTDYSNPASGSFYFAPSVEVLDSL
jgi:putative iron-dependent peroxidase